MLQYQLSQKYISFVSSLQGKERGEVLWGTQSILSHCPGYLQKRIKEITPEISIFKVGKEMLLLVYDDYAKRVLMDGSIGPKPEMENEQLETPLVSESIVSLLKKDDLPLPQDDLEKFLEANYFTNWFIKLMSKLPVDERNLFEKKKIIAPADKPIQIENGTIEKNAPAITAAPIVKEEKKPEPNPIKDKRTEEAKVLTPAKPIKKEEKPIKKTAKKQDVNGEEYEKAILAELSEAFAKRQQAKQKAPAAPLHHVKFAAQENVVSYKSENECLDLLLKRTRKNGCHLGDNDWLIILANTVDESFANVIESYYRNHVVYTDDPNKGNLRYAIIVKKDRKDDTQITQDELGVKLIHSKEASFKKSMPKGAFENIDEEDQEEAIEVRHNDNGIRMVKVKTAIFAPTVIEPINLINDDDGFTDFDDEEPSMAEANTGSIPEPSRDEEPAVPKFWHCYLCGKKKLYSGEPAETITLRNGETAYLCKKHRGKM